MRKATAVEVAAINKAIADTTEAERWARDIVNLIDATAQIQHKRQPEFLLHIELLMGKSRPYSKYESGNCKKLAERYERRRTQSVYESEAALDD